MSEEHNWQAYRAKIQKYLVIINSGMSRMDKAMHPMRYLLFFLAQWDVTLVYEHIPGLDNGAADALSRNSLL